LMCFTCLSPEFAGGLPGYCLTAADAGLERLALIGPFGLRSLSTASHYFMRRDSLHIQVEELSHSTWTAAGPQDRYLRLRAAALDAHNVAYIGETPPILGRFDVTKAQALGIPPGPLYGQLKSGISISLPDGRTITPDQVVEPTRPGASFAIIPCPNLDLLPRLAALFNTDSKESLDCLIHLAPAHVAESIQYKEWYRALGSHSVTHFLTHQHHISPFRTAIHDTKRLQALAPDLYAQIKDPTIRTKIQMHKNEVYAEPYLQFKLLPLDDKGIDRARLLDRQTIHVPTKIISDVQQISKTSPIPTDRDTELGDTEAQLLFLGTGSAIPSKHRNVSAIFLQCTSKAAMLLDAGEGTLGQLSKVFGSDGGLDKLAAVWISHPHADHHLGLPRILTQRAARFPHLDPIVLMAPTPVLSWLREYAQILGHETKLSSAYTPVDCTMICHKEVPHPCAQTLQKVLSLERCWNIRVDHCAHAYGLILHSVHGWSLCYSGDCRPTPELARQAKQVTVLIHEATFEDDKYLDAVAKKHSTLSEAISIGSDMNALRTVLTHFSQRYPDLPLLKPGQGDSLILASDFMTLSLPNLLWAPNLLPVLQALHGHHAGDADEGPLF